MDNLINRFPVILQVGISLLSNIVASPSLGEAGELQYSSDTHHLFVFPTQEGTPLPVQTLDMAVTDSDLVVCNNGEIVFNY